MVTLVSVVGAGGAHVGVSYVMACGCKCYPLDTSYYYEPNPACQVDLGRNLKGGGPGTGI